MTLAPHLTEMVFAAGAGDQLVGVDSFSDYPVQAQALPRVGDAFRVDLETLAQLSPDLVLAWASSAPPEMVARMVAMDLRVLVLEVEEVADVAKQIRQIGRLAGTEAAATAAADNFLEEFAALGRSEQLVGPRVFYQVSARPWFTVTRRHVVGQILEYCGAENIFGNLPELAPGVSLEAIVAAQPELIISARVAAQQEDWRSTWAEWPAVPAVQRGNLFSVNADLVSRPGPRLLEGAKELCRIVAMTSEG